MHPPEEIIDQDKIKRIKNLLKFRPKGLTISDISQKLEMNRNSVAKYLEILLISGHVEMKTYGAAKVFYLSPRIPISAMLSFSSDNILVLDKDLRIIQVNNNFLKFIGIDQRDLLGKQIYDAPLYFLQQLQLDSLLKKKPENREIACELSTTKNSETYYFRTKVIPTVFDDGGQGLTVIMEDVTKQKSGELALRDSEERFKSITELSPFPISIIDPQGSYLYVNKKFAEVFGYSIDDVPTGKVWFKLAFPNPTLRKKAMGYWKSDLKKAKIGEVRPRTFPVHCKDGSIREIIFRPVTLANLNQFVLYEDITEKRHAEQIQSFLAAIVESTGDAIIGKDLKGTIVSWNRAAEEMYGYSANEILGNSIATIIPEEKEGELSHFIEKIKLGETISNYETKRRRKNGDLIDVSLTISPIRDSSSTIVAASTIARNITELKKMKEEIQVNQEKLEEIIEFLPDPTFIIDRDKNVVGWNRAIEEMSGIKKRDIKGKSAITHLKGAFGSTSRPMLIDLFDQSNEELLQYSPPVKKVGDTLTTESYIPRLKKGVGGHIWIKASPLYDSKGNFIGAIESIRDISDWKQAHESLKRAREKIEGDATLRIQDLIAERDKLSAELQVFQHDLNKYRYLQHAWNLLTEKIFISDCTGSIQYVTDAMARTFGIKDVRDLIGSNIYEMMDQNSIQSLQQLLQHSDYTPETFTCTFSTKEGMASAKLSISLIRDRQRPIGFIGIFKEEILR